MNRAIAAAIIFSATLLVPPLASGGQSSEPQQPQQGTPKTADKPARDPNAYSDGYQNAPMPGMEQADRIAIGKLLADQLEAVSGVEGHGFAWDFYGSYGRDEQKFWLRSEGAVVKRTADYTTNVEALWWRAFKPFWATLAGVRQDFGPGAHTHAAFGVEGLAPYWFDIQATGYVADNGGVSARLKASYDLLFTNRLILSPEIETNVYSKANPARLLGTGMGNVELQARLRYEVSRKFAPYIGVDWDRAIGSTAGLRRAAGRHPGDVTIVAGLRAWR